MHGGVHALTDKYTNSGKTLIQGDIIANDMKMLTNGRAEANDKVVILSPMYSIL